MGAILDWPENALLALRIIHFSYPPALFVWFTTSQIISICTLENLRAKNNGHGRSLATCLQSSILGSYVIETILLLIRASGGEKLWSSSDDLIYALASILIWGIITIAIFDTKKPVWYPYYGSWLISLLAESCLLSLSIATTPVFNSVENARIILGGCRILISLTISLVILFLTAADSRNSDEENARLLSQEGNSSEYGTSCDIESEIEERRATTMKILKKIQASGNWWEYAKSYSIFWPFIWPQNDRWLQISIGLIGLCLLAIRFLNVMVPHQAGLVTNALMDGRVPWLQLLLYVFYRWLDSTSGIPALKDYLWIPVEQYSYSALGSAAYNHVMSLSYDFHSNKKTGEIWSCIVQGRSVSGFIEIILFQLAPMFIDLCVAFAYFFILFDAYMAMIVAFVIVVYLWVTTKLSSIKTVLRRELNKRGREETGIMIETVSSWTTVSYFNRIPYEQNRYQQAINFFQMAERKWLIAISILGIAQSFIFTVGLLAACFLAVYEVTKRIQQVGSFVTLLSYWAQLSGPLSFFAHFYRRIETHMLDAERLLELMQTKPDVVDRQNAITLENVHGDVVFGNVCFSYDSRKESITNVSFHVPAGTTVALVGETGGGKSTCLKLLFRFYDVSSGLIKIDGHDIRDLELSSMRDHIGVVPQDPQLFNDTIMSNIKYSNFDATDEDVYAACRAASIHEKILTYPEGYQSKVGERGVKLSGGELQRVAIARAILKNPKIVLLDEATSMVDVDTEQKIQGALKKLSKNRTMFIVAHRLSTIMSADQIVVMKDGGIIEKGTHNELLKSKGHYHRLWFKQFKIENDSVQAKPTPKVFIDQLSDTKSCGPESKAGVTVNQMPRKVQVPRATDVGTGSSKTEACQPSVTFSLPDRNSQPPMFPMSKNPRNSVPKHGILKNGTLQQQSSLFDKAGVGTVSRPGSVLKPDAQEFFPSSKPPIASAGTNPASTMPDRRIEAPTTTHLVPKEVTVDPLIKTPGKVGHRNDSMQTIHQTPSLPPLMVNVPRPEDLIQKQEIARAQAQVLAVAQAHAHAKTLDQQAQPKPQPPSLALAPPPTEPQEIGQVQMPQKISEPLVFGASIPDTVTSHSGTDRNTKDANVETNNQQEQKKRRRRTRRRNNKLKSVEAIDKKDQNIENATGKAILAQISRPYIDVENEEQPWTDNGGSSTNGKLPKWRFRSGSKPKLKKAEPENEEPNHTAESSHKRTMDSLGSRSVSQVVGKSDSNSNTTKRSDSVPNIKNSAKESLRKTPGGAPKPLEFKNDTNEL